MKRRELLKAAAAASGAALLPRAFAQDFPARPITLIVPFAPGGNLDTVARVIAPRLSALMNAKIVVENRPGAGGAIGAGLVARSKPDGYTMLISTPNAIAVLPRMVKVPYTTKSFQPVGLISSTSLVLVVKADDARFKDAAGLLAYAKQNPQKLSAGYAGVGTTNHIGLLLMEDAAKAQLNAIPYNGSGPALVDLLGGQIDLVVDQLTSSIAHINAGKLRALAVLGAERDPLIKDVPTLREASLDNFDVSTLTGLLCPAGTPQALVDALNGALTRALAEPELKAKLLGVGSIARASTPKEFEQILVAEEKRGLALASAGKLKAQ
jgi:tripartite-type tricarboxylate transporter receptor subunit TctC